MGRRRRARESALQILFGLEWSRADPDQAVDDYWGSFAGERPAAYEQILSGSRDLVLSVVSQQAEIDRLLQASSHHWKLERMAVVDRNILRIAVYEILCRSEVVPRKVVINEAVEIAKKFGSEDSPAFVNGILDRVFHDVGEQVPEDEEAATAEVP
jgi:N utilization substance protein B